MCTQSINALILNTEYATERVTFFFKYFATYLFIYTPFFLNFAEPLESCIHQHGKPINTSVFYTTTRKPSLQFLQLNLENLTLMYVIT